MKIYLDVSRLNRPFDDQNQSRIRVETTAVTLIFERVDAGLWQQVSSEMAVIEIDAISDTDRRNRVRMLLPESTSIMKLNKATFDRAEVLGRIGFRPADAVHVAAAERAKADVLLSCDDRLCRLAKRRKNDLQVQVANPVDWLKEMDDADA
ncbi:MAG: PIN domain-containing protein [Planctomycetota bacterium]|nr:PIN domain-containing protein [Planctomycetota bacterium]